MGMHVCECVCGCMCSTPEQNNMAPKYYILNDKIYNLSEHP